DTHDPIRARRSEVSAVGTKRDGVDLALMTDEGFEFRAPLLLQRGRIPNAHGLIGAGGSQKMTVRAEGHGPYSIDMTVESNGFQARGHGPDLDLLVTPRRGQTAAVGTENEGPDRAGVSPQGVDQLAADRAPDADFPFLSAKRCRTRGHELAIGAECHVEGGAVGNLEGQEFLARGHVPNCDRAAFSDNEVSSSDGDAAAVGAERQPVDRLPWRKGKGNAGEPMAGLRVAEP